jgi:hypothetical protein
MNEQALRSLIAAVGNGRLSRRAFARKMVGLGLTAPFAARLLAHAGLAQTAAQSEYKPTKAGGGGQLKVLFWQAPTLLNPHFAVGTKDQEGARIFYEPLAAWDPDGNLVPVLAAEVPEIENGGVAPDGLSVTWKLKKNVQWHDGQPFTADDVVFNWEYAADPATAATTIGSYQNITVEKLDPSVVRVRFKKPTRRGRHDPPDTFVRDLQGRQLARRASRPEAGRHRSLPVCRVQAGRPGQRRTQSFVPCRQSALFRHHRNERRRRRRLGSAGGYSERRVRLCLEHAG